MKKLLNPIVIENTDIAQTYRGYFNLLWKISRTKQMITSSPFRASAKIYSTLFPYHPKYLRPISLDNNF